MNSQVRDFFRVDVSQDAHFQEVRFLSEEVELDWEEMNPLGLTRGWYEFSRISPEDRVEFSRENWLQQLSFHPTATRAIGQFFDKLDDVVVVLSRASREEPWTAELVYSLADNSSFFRGMPPADEGEIAWAQEHMGALLPSDYWAFFRLHNGFGRLKNLGFLPLDEIVDAKRRLMHTIVRSERPLRWEDSWIDPESLYPFFEEDGAGSFQCFNAEWYPSDEMGNVYFSSIDYTLSNIDNRKMWAEQLAYPSFLEWVAAFLGGVNAIQ